MLWSLLSYTRIYDSVRKYLHNYRQDAAEQTAIGTVYFYSEIYFSAFRRFRPSGATLCCT